VEGANFFQGKNSALNITAATVVKVPADNGAVGGLAEICRIVRVQVIVAGSAAGAVYDSKATTGNSAANQVAVLPNTVGTYLIDMPCFTGIVVAPGTGQTVAVSFD
jgi:hypothetical protein